MQQIYEHSRCNIAATKASNSQGGLFFDRDTSIVHLVKVNLQWESFPSTSYCCWDAYIWDRLIENPVLVHRAWMQGRILSPRVLHFVANKLLWECPLFEPVNPWQIRHQQFPAALILRKLD